MKRQVVILILGLILNLISVTSIFAQVKACINIPSSYPYPIKQLALKTAWICKGTSINLIGSNCLGTTTPVEEEYSWINLSNTTSTSSAQNFFPSDTGKWELTITNLNDYSIDKDTIHLIYFNTPNFAINGNASVIGACLNQNIILRSNKPTGTSNFNWYIENDPISKGTTDSLKFQSNSIPGGAAFYSVSADYKGTYVGGNYTCLLADTILAYLYQTPAVSLGNDTSICKGQSINLQANVSLLPDYTPVDPLSGYSYQWNSSGVFQDKIFTYQTSTTESSTRKYYVIVRNLFGCQAKDSIQVTIKPGLSVNVGSALSVCAGSNVQLDAIVTGANGNISYTWSPSTGLNNANIKSPNVTINSNSTYSVAVKDQEGCTGVATKQINISPGLDITITKDTTLCPGNNITLSAMVTGSTSTAGYSYKWTPTTYLSSSSISDPVSSPSNNISYSVEISDQFGCKGTASTSISINPPIVLAPAFTDSTTIGMDVIQLLATVSGGSGGFKYLWTPGSLIDVNSNIAMNVNPSETTTYSLTAEDINGCKAKVDVLVDKLRLDIGSNDTIGVIGDSIKLNAFNTTQLGFSYKWIDSVGNIISTNSYLWIKEEGPYVVFVYNPITNSFVRDSIYVRFVKEIRPIVEVPNVLSPTMQNESDKHLRVYGQGISDDNFIFQIYDQWGNLVYESHSFKEANEMGWNGSFKNNGQNLALGVYTYSVRGEFKDGTSFSKTGTASLIK